MIDIIFTVFLIIHVLGDFYFQTENMAVKKDEKFYKLLQHSVIYLAIAQLCIIPMWSREMMFYAFILSIVHFIIDLLKYLTIRIVEELKNERALEILNREQDKGTIYILDQLLHIISIYLLSYFVSYQLEAIEMLGVFKVINIFRMEILRTILMFILILKPVNVTFRKLLSNYKPVSKISEKNEEKRVGKLIGNLERMLVLVFLLVNQYTAIGLVFTAKSITRFNKISDDKMFAEYYLLGTLFSILATVVIYIAIQKI